jgi:hypothetical protein
VSMNEIRGGSRNRVTPAGMRRALARCNGLAGAVRRCGARPCRGNGGFPYTRLVAMRLPGLRAGGTPGELRQDHR